MKKLSSGGLLLSGFIRLLGINSPPSPPGPTAWDTALEDGAGVTPAPGMQQVQRWSGSRPAPPVPIPLLPQQLPTAAQPAGVSGVEGEHRAPRQAHLVLAVPALSARWWQGWGWRKFKS